MIVSEHLLCISSKTIEFKDDSHKVAEQIISINQIDDKFFINEFDKNYLLDDIVELNSHINKNYNYES